MKHKILLYTLIILCISTINVFAEELFTPKEGDIIQWHAFKYIGWAKEYDDIVDEYQYKDGNFYSANIKNRYNIRFNPKNTKPKKAKRARITYGDIRFTDTLWKLPFLSQSSNQISINRKNGEYHLYARNYYPILFKKRARAIGTCTIVK